ncbi:MAG: hypothetical protein AAGA77_12310 [Bacteroidota bacterium]
MKPILAFLTLFLCIQFGTSQSIVKPDKKWEGYYEINFNNWFQAKFRNSTKTIEGKEYIELMYKVEPGGWFEGSRRYYREEDNKVYRYEDGAEKIVLDLGLSVGDTIVLEDNFGDVFEFFPIRVTDTIIFNKQLKLLEMRVRPENEDVSNVPHVWIEGVGDVGFFFDGEYVFGNINARPIFCVSDDRKVYSALTMCPDLVSTTAASDSDRIDFWYDQASKKLYLKNISNASLDVYSLIGEKVRTYDNVEEYNGLVLNQISMEMCVVVVRDGPKVKSKILRL